MRSALQRLVPPKKERRRQRKLRTMSTTQLTGSPSLKSRTELAPEILFLTGSAVTSRSSSSPSLSECVFGFPFVCFGFFLICNQGTEIITDTELELNYGRRYGLLGANGSGKTMLLTCLGKREAPLPPHIDCYQLSVSLPSRQALNKFMLTVGLLV